MKEKLAKIREEILKQIDASENLDKLNEVRVSALGKKGALTELLKSMKEVAPQDRPKVGQMVNEVRAEIETALETEKAKLEDRAMEARLKNEVIDVTLPAKKNSVGQRIGRKDRYTRNPGIQSHYIYHWRFDRTWKRSAETFRLCTEFFKDDISTSADAGNSAGTDLQKLPYYQP